MLSDPMSVTYNGVVKTLPRVSLAGRKGVSKHIGGSQYRSADGEFSVYVDRYSMGDSVDKIEIILERVELDNGVMSDGITPYRPNRFGFVYEVNHDQVNTITDLNHLQLALSTFVSDAIELRLLGGES